VVARRDRGSSLLVAILALVVVSVAAQALHGILLRDLGGLRAERRAVELRALTDAALASTLARLQGDPTAPGAPRQRLGNGTFESLVRPAGAGLVDVLAAGETGGLRAVVSARVALGPDGPRVVRWERSAPVAFGRR
jgi:hypothetical protein